MYPSSQKPYSGVFVKNQYEELRSRLNGQTDSVEIYYMKRSFTGIFGTLWKYFIAVVKFTPYYFRSYDIVHLHYFYPLIILCWIYRRFHPKTRVVVTFHGGDINTQLNGGINQELFKLLSRCIDISIAVSKPLEKTVIEKLGLSNTMVLSAGVNQKIFYPPSARVPKIYNFIFVGTFERRKGVDLIIDAIRALNHRDLRYCFVGSGPLYDNLKQLANEYHIDIFSNLSQPQIRKKFYKSWFHVLPSRSEPFGLVVSEAMFCGIPSIVTPEGGLTEQVQDGINGFICTNISVEGVLLAFKRALEISPDKWLFLSENAKKNKGKFSLDTVCSEHLRLYHSLYDIH